MRNLLEHPITKEEIIDYLKILENDLDWEQAGSIGPTLLEEAIKHVRGSKLELSDLGTVQDNGEAMGGG